MTLILDLPPGEDTHLGAVVTVSQPTGERLGRGTVVRVRRGQHTYEGFVVVAHRTSRHLEVRLDRQTS